MPVTNILTINKICKKGNNLHKNGISIVEFIFIVPNNPINNYIKKYI